MADVKAFPGVTMLDKDAKAQPKAHVIKEIERLLACAKSGDMRAIAFSYVRSNGWSSYGWSGSEGYEGYALHSGLMTALTAMGVEFDAMATPSPPIPETDDDSA